MIDLKKVLSYSFSKYSERYTEKDVMLYHLVLGGGIPATCNNELEYTYEKKLKVLPTFSATLGLRFMAELLRVPGLNFDFDKILHREQETIVHVPLPVEAKVNHNVTIENVYDKGKNAVIVIRVDTWAAEEYNETFPSIKLATNRYSLFLRGAGGFGGDRGPKTDKVVVPEKIKEQVLRPTQENQALFYRQVSGDIYAIHADPEIAKQAGMEAPILHGLCSYGIVCKAAVDTILGGDVKKVARCKARFTGVFYPGDTLVIKLWEEDDKIFIDASSYNTKKPVMTYILVIKG